MDFRETYREFADDIRVTALGQRVPGFDHDDVASEMTVCLWRATKTYRTDLGVSFGAFWWSLWLNRKKDLLRAASALKRPPTIPMAEPWETGYDQQHVPMPPEGTSGVAALVWLMLASGEVPKDLIMTTGLSRRHYYNLIHRWRTADVYNLLKG